VEAGAWALETWESAISRLEKHAVDDTPFGGGSGMVIGHDVVDAAIAAAWPIRARYAKSISVREAGRLTQAVAQELAARPQPDAAVQAAKRA